MAYKKIILEAVVSEDESEVFIQLLNNALDIIEGDLSIQISDIREEDTADPRAGLAPLDPDFDPSAVFD